jgi:23S rRNA pseudouridine1911/1915/1917 synthase
VESYRILYEDEDILVANKLAPIPVQPEKTGDKSLQDLLRDALTEREELSKRDMPIGHDASTGRKPPDGRDAPFLEAAHRIDRRASGAVLFAKTHIALSTLEAAFRDKRVKKEYLACVEREPEPRQGKLEHNLAWDKRRNVVRALAPGSKSGKSAALEYSVAGKSDRYFFVSVNLITGRHHQVRAQLAAIGCPIRGDLKYGARRSSPSGLIMLHARRLSFFQPRTQEAIDILAPFPEAEPLWAAYTDVDDEGGSGA